MAYRPVPAPRHSLRRQCSQSSAVRPRERPPLKTVKSRSTEDHNYLSSKRDKDCLPNTPVSRRRLFRSCSDNQAFASESQEHTPEYSLPLSRTTDGTWKGQKSIEGDWCSHDSCEEYCYSPLKQTRATPLRRELSLPEPSTSKLKTLKEDKDEVPHYLQNIPRNLLDPVVHRK